MEIIQTLQEWFNLNSMLTVAIRIAGVVLIALFVIFFTLKVLRKFQARLEQRDIQEGEIPSEAKKRSQTLFALGRQAVLFVIWLVAAMMILNELGVEIGPMLAGAGIAGIAIGFGAQSLVKDYFAGFFLILEDQVRVGDAARVNGIQGFVEEINFRTMILRDRTGEVHIFPHGTVSTLSNLSDEWSAYLFNVGVAYKENTDVVVEHIEQVVAEMRADSKYGPLIIEDVMIYGVDEFADSAVVIQGRIKTVPIKQWEVGREFLRRLKHVFDANNIEIPFPHRTLYFGEASKPIQVSTENKPSNGDES